MDETRLMVNTDEANGLREKIADLINILLGEIRSLAKENTVVENGEFISALVGSTTELMKMYMNLL